MDAEPRLRELVELRRRHRREIERLPLIDEPDSVRRSGWVSILQVEVCWVRGGFAVKDRVGEGLAEARHDLVVEVLVGLALIPSPCEGGRSLHAAVTTRMAASRYSSEHCTFNWITASPLAHALDGGCLKK